MPPEPRESSKPAAGRMHPSHRNISNASESIFSGSRMSCRNSRERTMRPTRYVHISRFGGLTVAAVLFALSALASDNGQLSPPPSGGTVVVPEPQDVGGEAEGIVRVANLI